MNIKRIVLLFFMTLACLARANAQDVVYSQFYANPLYLNPALAGSKLSSRITLNYRNQWPGYSHGYVSYNAAWDRQFDKLKGGLGVVVNSDVAGEGIYNRFSASGIYSYRLQASRFLVLNAAMQAGYFQYKLDWDKMIFGDQMIDVVTGQFQDTKEERPPKLTIGNVDFSAGILGGYKESLYFGIAVNHLSRPNIAFYDTDENKMNMRLTVHSGMVFDLYRGLDGAMNAPVLSMSPHIIYVQQGKFRQLNAGMQMNLFPLEAGLWVRHNFGNPDGIIVMFAFEQVNFKVGYSFDYTISRLRSKSTSANEISFSWLFNTASRDFTLRKKRY